MAGRESNVVTPTLATYLKVAIHYLNDNEDEVDLRLGRPLRLDDLDKLTSENMLKIVRFFMLEIIGNKPVSRQAALTEFNNMGLGDSFYDCGIDVIYNAAKQIFPEDNDVFHYSVLLMPAKDPKRTRSVIACLIELVNMCGEFHRQFKDCFDNVVRENAEKSEICAAIDELKEQINELVQELVRNKERVPVIQQEVDNMQLKIHKQQNTLSNLKSEWEKHKGKYEEEEMNKNQLQKDLENLCKVALEWESKIVSSPEAIQSSYADAKSSLDWQTQRREAFALKLEKLRRECETLDSLMCRANGVIDDFNAIIYVMNEIKNEIDSNSKSGSDVSKLVRDLDNLRNQISVLEEKYIGKRQELDDKVKESDSSIQQIGQNVERIKLEIQEHRHKTVKVLEARKQVARDMEKCNAEVDKIEADIKKFMYQIETVLPEQRKSWESDIQEHMQLLEKYREYPLLKIEPKADYVAKLSLDL